MNPDPWPACCWTGGRPPNKLPSGLTTRLTVSIRTTAGPRDPLPNITFLPGCNGAERGHDFRRGSAGGFSRPTRSRQEVPQPLRLGRGQIPRSSEILCRERWVAGAMDIRDLDRVSLKTD